MTKTSDKKMIKKILFLLILIFSFNLSINAQDNDFLIGKWIFKDVYNKEKIDRSSLEQLNTDIINKMSINLQKNGNYEAYVMGENTDGKWSRTKNGFILNTLDGPFEFSIIKLTKNELALKIGLGEFLMVKK